MLAFIHVPIIFHQLWKHIFISKDTSLGDLELVRIAFDGLLKFFDTSENGIDLESEAPSFWFLVILFEHIDIFPSEILPFLNRLFNPLSLGDVMPEDFEEGGLSTTDISFNGEAELVGICFGIDEILDLHLSTISR